jgi:hypothetical protein
MPVTGFIKEKKMNRWRVSAILAGVFLASIISLPALADGVPTLSINPASSTVSVGNNVTPDVDISNISDLYAFQFDLSFDRGIVSAVSITEGSFLSAYGCFLAGMLTPAIVP